jgi:AmmeMemoRadiSam system protein B
MTPARTSLRVRPPAVAGLFYPDDPNELAELLNELLQGDSEPQAKLKALIAPHAGYAYSGVVAAAAFRLLRAEVGRVRRVVLLGPSHRIPFRGLAVPTVAAFATPLGELPVDARARDALLGLSQIHATDAPHAEEHSLEVELPFLQTLLGSFDLLPIAAGDASAAEVAETLDAVWGGPDTLIVVSTDLSHYHDYETARILDRATNQAILAFTERLGGEQACGCVGLNGFLRAAQARALRIELLDLRNSGDTAGDRARVVGYGAWAIFDA